MIYAHNSVIKNLLKKNCFRCGRVLTQAELPGASCFLLPASGGQLLGCSTSWSRW